MLLRSFRFERIGVSMADKSTCSDKKCYIHGDVKVRGGRLVGVVKNTKMRNGATIELDRTLWFPKYKRYARAKSLIHAHNPECINAKVGDTVLLGETRRLSKTIAWTIMSVIKKTA